MAKPIDSDMQVQSGATLSAASGGVVDATEINGVPIPNTNSGTAGKIPITQGDGSAAWADPYVQGVFPPGTVVATANGTSPAVPLYPILIGIKDGSGNLQDVSASNPVPVTGSVTASGTVTVEQATAASLNATVVFPSAQHIIVDSGSIDVVPPSNQSINLVQVNGHTTVESQQNGVLAIGGHSASGTALTSTEYPLLIAGSDYAGTPAKQVLKITSAGVASVAFEAAQDVNVSSLPSVTVGTWAAGTLPVTGDKTNNNAAPDATNVAILSALCNTAAPTYTDGKVVMPSCDTTGALRVTGAGGASVVVSGTVALSSYAFTEATLDGCISASKLAVRASDGDVYVRSNAAATFPVTATIASSQTIAVTQATAANLNATVVGTGTFAVQATVVSGGIADGGIVTLGAKTDAKSTATDGTSVTIMQVLKEISAMEQAPASRAVTNTGTFAVQAAATLAAETTKVIGTVNQGTSPWVVSQTTASNLLTNINASGVALTAQTGGYLNTALYLGTSAVSIGTQTAANSVPVALPTATITTLTPPTASAIGTAVAAALTNPLPVSLTSTTITGTVACTESGPWSVRNQDGLGNGLTTNSSTYSSKFALDGNLLGTLGTAFSTAGKVDIKGADGDVFVRQATAANLNCTAVLAAGSAVVGSVKVTDGTNTATVKAASVAALATDTALVVTTNGSTTAGACANTSVTSTSSAALAANTARREVTIVNTDTVVVYLGLGQTPTATAYHIALTPCSVAHDGTGGTYTSDVWKGAINAIVASTTGHVAVTELT